MNLEILFENQEGVRKWFKWEMFDRRHSYAWADLMTKWKETWPEGVPTFKDGGKWFLSATEEDFKSYIKEIKELVERIDSIGEHYVGSQDIHENITRTELNRIHEEFHKYVETCDKETSNPKIRETEALCHRLNDLVHLTEIAEVNRHKQRPDKRVIATATPHMQVDYDEQDYNHFETTMRKGYVYVGYATPGKNLYHCFCDNDVPVVEKKLVRQSQGLSNELHIEFDGATEIDQQFENQHKSAFYEWCEKNNVRDYGYDYTQPQYNPGRIPLAKPLDDMDDLILHLGLKPGKIVDIKFT